MARGQVDAAATEGATASAVARRSKDLQVLLPALWCQAAVTLALERKHEATELALEVLGYGDAIINLSFEFIFDFADLISRLGQDAELERVIVSGSSGFWHAPMLHFARAEYRAAADTLAKFGNRVGEARARLRAAEVLAVGGDHAEASLQLEAASAFYRSVQATAELERARLVARQMRGSADADVVVE